MHTHPNHDTPDIDALLRRQPIEPSEDFVQNTLVKQRGAKESATDIDNALDHLLARQIIDPAADFTDRVFTTARSQTQTPTIMGLPSWVFALGTMAATLAAMMIAFTWMFNRGIADNQALLASRSTAVSTPPDKKVIDPTTAPPPVSLETDALQVAEAASFLRSDDRISTAEIEIIDEWLAMDEALLELSNLSEDNSVWESLALLSE